MDKIDKAAQALNDVWDELKQRIPNLSHISFERSVTGFYREDAGGWLHAGPHTLRYDNPDHLKEHIKRITGRERRNEILFRKY